MALPTKEKTWQYGTSGDPNAFVNVVCQGSSVENTMQKVWFAIKNSLINMPTAPWVVVGSCDGTSYAMDGTDYWVDELDLNWNTTTNPHSWIVLKQTGVSTSYSLCFECRWNTSGYGYGVIAVANGGYNTGTGDTSVRPTALDDELILCNYNEYPTWVNATTNSYGVVNVMQSTDGQCTRVVGNSANASCFMLLLDKVKNPITGWTNPSCSAFVRNSTGNDAITYSNLNDTSVNSRGYVSSLACNLGWATLGRVNQMLGEEIDAPNDLDGGYEMYPIWLYSTTTTRKGTLGQLYDIWFGTQIGPVTGDTYPGDSSRTFAHFAEVVFPWNGDVPQITV